MPRRAQPTSTPSTRRWSRRINDDGRIYLTQTRHEEKFVIRFQVGQTSTTRADVMLAWDVIREIADRLPRAVAAAARAASS